MIRNNFISLFLITFLDENQNENIYFANFKEEFINFKEENTGLIKEIELSRDLKQKFYILKNK